MAAFWVVSTCSLVEAYRRFLLIALMMDAANTSETSVNFKQTSRPNNPEDSHFRSNNPEDSHFLSEIFFFKFTSDNSFNRKTYHSDSESFHTHKFDIQAVL
jgi:hypothetical protein